MRLHAEGDERRRNPKMRRRITLLIVAAIMALTLLLGGATAAFAGKHHPNKSPACVKDRGGDNPNCPGKRR
jgi:heme A synthase